MDKLRHLKQSKVKDRIAERELSRKRIRQALHCQIRNIETEAIVETKDKPLSKKESKMNRLKECRELRQNRDNNIEKPPLFVTTVPVGRYVTNPAEIKFEKMLARKNEMRAAKSRAMVKSVSEKILTENNPSEIKFDKMVDPKNESRGVKARLVFKTVSEKELTENKGTKSATKSATEIKKKRNPRYFGKPVPPTISLPDGINIKLDEVKLVVNVDDISPIETLSPIVCSQKRTHSTPFVRQMAEDEESDTENNNTSYIVEEKPCPIEATNGTFIWKNYRERPLKSFDDFLNIASEFKEMLSNIISFWKRYQETNINDLNDENNDLINREIGQANLFLNKKLTSFTNLATIDSSIKSRQIFITDIEGFYVGCVTPSLKDLEKRFNDLKALKDCNWLPIKTRKSNKIAASNEIFGLLDEEIPNKRMLRSSRLGTPKTRKSERHLKTPTHMDQCTGCTPRKSMSTPATPKSIHNVRKSNSTKNMLNMDSLDKNDKPKKSLRTVSFA